MSEVAKSKRGRKPKLVHEEDVFWGHDGTYVDIEGTQDIRQFAMEERGERRPEFVAPGAEQKWRARNLVDFHWKLTAIEIPSESYNSIFSCIIDHANPGDGFCYPSQSIIAIETGYSVDTVQRAIRWWKEQGFLTTESRGLGHALAYHPQWDLLESFYVGVTSDIEEQKASYRTKGRYGEPQQGAVRVPQQGAVREPHHGAVHNLKLEPQTLTPKNEPHPERVISPSVKVTTPLEGQLLRGKEEGIQRGEVESASTNPDPPEGPTDGEIQNIVSEYCRGVWDLIEPSEFDAAMDAELREPGAGRAVIAAVVDAKLKGNANG